MYQDFMYMFDNNIYAFVLLGILLIVVVVKKDIYDYTRKLFYRMLIFNMILLFVEVFAWAFDGIVTPFAFVANYIFNVLLILLEPIMASMWLAYVDYKINRSRDRLRKRWFYLQPSIFSGLLLIINIFTPVAFSIDSNNVYHRGGYLWLSLVFVFALVLYSLVLAVKTRKVISDKMIAFIAFFALLPVLVSFIQLFVYGLILTWAVVALGIVLAYYMIEISGNSVDYLTQLHSRKKIEEIIRGRIERELPFGVIMIDLEFFKNINDEFGHKKGDEVLIHFGRILISVFGKRNFVSRIGGDEFLIVCDNIANEDLVEFRAEIKKSITNYSEFDLVRKISFSFGGALFDGNQSLSVDKIFDDVDYLMYQDKSKNKNKRRRRTDREQVVER